VYEAIVDGDAEAAEAAMKTHIIDFWHRLRLATQRDR
jgi:DNA-binding FadR family transcriptional regulator